MGSRYEHVFAPIRIRGVDFRNRIELAPPSLNLASLDHKVTHEFVDLNRSIAYGGAAILSVGNVMVDIEECCNEELQLDMSTDECILPLSWFSQMCEGFGAHASLEINPAARTLSLPAPVTLPTLPPSITPPGSSLTPRPRVVSLLRPSK